MNSRDQALLLALAREAIACGAAGDHSAIEREALPPALARPAAVFVTLTRDGVLRGCIGGLEARHPLAEATARAAVNAAFHDPRFAPVTAAELPSLEMEVSVLSALEEVAFGEETQLLAQLDRGVHGLLIEQDEHRATFLPKVWESVSEPALFLALLKRKAGLSPFAPLVGARAWRYTADVIGCEVAGADVAPVPNSP